MHAYEYDGSFLGEAMSVGGSYVAGSYVYEVNACPRRGEAL